MKKFPSDARLKAFAARFKESGFSLYAVGGAVRDFLLSLPNSDYDFATDATPEEVMKIFPRVIPTGIKHGTVTVLFRGASYEVTTFRTEGAYSDSRHPDSVSFVRSLDEDLKRRDFTINAFAADIYTGEIIDLNGGWEDLKSKTLRAIGNPKERFEEDALRMLRACRFAAKLGFEIESATFEAIRESAHLITKVSEERIYSEICSMLSSAAPQRGIRLMHESSLLPLVLPEIEAEAGCEQNGGRHRKDVFGHTLDTLEASAFYNAPLRVRFAALFHDSGKPLTRKEKGDGPRDTFHGHETAGAAVAEKALRRLKAPNEMISSVSLLVRNHMLLYSPSWSDGAVRRFINRVGRENIADLFLLIRSDRSAIFGEEASLEDLEELSVRITRILTDRDALTIKDLAVNGDKLAAAGIKRGPVMGAILNELLETVLDDPSQNTESRLTAIAVNIYNTKF